MAFIRLNDDIIINTDQIAKIYKGGAVFGNSITLSSGEEIKLNGQAMRLVLETIGL